MVQGINTNVEYRGEIFHIQSEDCGRRKRMIKTLVFEKGEVVTAVETSYAALAQSPNFTEKEVGRRLTIQHWRIAEDLQRGALYVNGEGPREAQVERRRCADRRAKKKEIPPEKARHRPAVLDRRITMLAIGLAAVSVMLTVLAIRDVPSVSNTDGDPTATAALPERAPVEPQSSPPLVAAPAEPPVVDVRQPDALPPAAPEPRAAPKRSQPRVTSPPPAPVATPRAPRTVASPSPTVVAASLSEAPSTITPVAVEPKERPVAPEPAVMLGDLVALAEVDVPPRPTSRELPSYTKRAKKKKQQGTVEMDLLINERGVVSDLRLKRTIPDSDLNDVAIHTVRRWRFDPARVADVAVRAWKPVSIVYSIESGQTRVALLE